VAAPAAAKDRFPRRQAQLKKRLPLPFRSVRAKLLVMLVLLSLPLLIISLVQLNSYRQSLKQEASTVTQIETTAASGALSSWLEGHPLLVSDLSSLSTYDALDLYHRLDQHIYAIPQVTTAVFDAKGNFIVNPSNPGPYPGAAAAPSVPSLVRWSDGITRMTQWQGVHPWGWKIAVGVPQNSWSLGGYSLFVLAASWAFGVIASILLGIWAVGRFTKPLRELAGSAAVLGTGRLSERASIATDDEIGDLANNFNAMASQLESKFREVQTQGAFIEEVIDGFPLGVAVLDGNMLLRKANPMFAAFVGRSPQELAGRGIYEAAAGLAVLRDVIEDVSRSRKPFVSYSLPLTLIPQNKVGEDDGAGAYFDVTVWPITERSSDRGNLIVVLSEVSKRVRAEMLATAAFSSERTRAAELESVINQMNEGVVIIDQHRHYKINVAGMAILGRKREDFRDGADALIEDFALKDLDGKVVEPDMSPLWRALTEHDSISNEQYKIERLGGGECVISISAAPLKNDAGDVEGAVAVIRDNTESVRSHEELVSAYDRLREHDRLKSAFVSNVTHELRTPLNVIIGLCQLLERDSRAPLAPLQEDAVTRMERNARSLLELVNDLIDYSRLEAGRSALRLEWIDVPEILERVAKDYSSSAAEKGIELRTRVTTDLLRVLSDEHKLLQVLSNLVANAVKFTSNGNVTISAGALEDEQWFVEVSDTGIGISMDAVQFIFDEFRQVDDRLSRSYGGTGLGLAITRKITDLLEGKIEVESKPGEGSRFRITWPRTVRQRTGTGSLSDSNVLLLDAAKLLRSRAS
jgi:signal transduction histidine kinase